MAIGKQLIYVDLLIDSMIYMVYSLKIAIEIVDFPIKNGGSFHSYVNVPQAAMFHPYDRRMSFFTVNADHLLGSPDSKRQNE